jgi:hypothetical protein
MYDNALRCIESDLPILIGMAQTLGALNSDGIAEAGVLWDYIGYKNLEGGGVLEDGNGNKYVHINVRTPFSVGQRAIELSAGNPAIGAALADSARFFVIDAQGNAVLPEFPIRCIL